MIRRLKIKQPTPLRYFKSDFLERFTHVHLWQVWAVWGPISGLATLYCFYLGGRTGLPLLKILPVAFLMIAAGIVFWTLLEYFLHRFIFHYDGKSNLRHKISWYSHGIHHAQAMLKTRLVMPIIVSLAIGLIIVLLDWVIFALIGNIGWVGCAFFTGIAYGYLFYDTIHWSVHFYDTDWKWYHNLRKNHMRHHRYPQKRFGVSNTLWDYVFRTRPSQEEEQKLPHNKFH